MAPNRPPEITYIDATPRTTQDRTRRRRTKTHEMIARGTGSSRMPCASWSIRASYPKHRWLLRDYIQSTPHENYKSQPLGQGQRSDFKYLKLPQLLIY
ncbi:hypothetical protein BHE74_00018625 [Ensete ventricosum]|nr:hypothetical protein BHE74_00018625 [Ensete ventricosum]